VKNKRTKLLLEQNFYTFACENKFIKVWNEIMKESIQESGQKPLTSFRDINEFHAYLDAQNKGALKAVAEMSKRPVSLEDMRKQTHRIQMELRSLKN
jgi:hypothetical protein